MRHSHLYNTVFDEERIEQIAENRSPNAVRETLRSLGVTHILVDWSEIARHRKPGGYGYTDFVQPKVFEGLVRAGVLERLTGIGPSKDLFRVRSTD